MGATEAWVNDPTTREAFGFIIDEELTDAADLRSLFLGDESWLDDLVREVHTIVSGRGFVWSPVASSDDITGEAGQDAQEWRVAGFDPDEATRWQRSGFRRVKTAAQWRDAAFAPDNAWAWYDVDVRGPDVAREWLESGWWPREAAPWLDIGGINPGDASELIAGGASPSDVENWRRHGVTDLGVICDLVRQCATADDLTALLRRGAKRSVAIGWLTYGFDHEESVWSNRHSWAGHLFSAPDAAAWSQAGVADAVGAAEWRRAGFAPADGMAWIRVGVSAPDVARAWTALGIESHQLRAWSQLGVEHPRDIGLTRARGIDDAKLRAWLSADFTVDQLLRLLDAGIEAESLDQWIERDWSFESTLAWHHAGFVPGAADDWHSAGFVEPAEAARWMALHFAARNAKSWRRALVDDPAEAKAWLRVPVSPIDVPLWRSNGVLSPAAAAAWCDAGVRDPHLAGQWVRLGVADPSMARGLLSTKTLEDVQRLLAVGLTLREVRGFYRTGSRAGDAAELAAQFSKASRLAAWRRSEIPPHQWPAWIRVCGKAEIAAEWSRAGFTPGQLERLGRTDGLNPGRLPAWLKAGCTATDMVEASSAGIREPSAWVAKLVASGPDESDLWMQAARPWLDAAGIDATTWTEFLDLLYEENLEWAMPHEDVFGVDVPDDWYDEVLDRATYLTETLAREPRWPTVFDSEQLTIVLDASARYAVAWVGCEGRGLLVSFDTETFDVFVETDSPSWDYAAGLAVSWYLDCCIVIRAERVGQFSKMARGRTGLGFDRVHDRYMPRPSFARHESAVAHGRRDPPRPHWVAGFKRTFRQGQRPTEEARSRAPARVRRTLKANQTWVSAHARGGIPLLDELRTYLSKYSALADALGLARVTPPEDDE